MPPPLLCIAQANVHRQRRGDSPEAAAAVVRRQVRHALHEPVQALLGAHVGASEREGPQRRGGRGGEPVHEHSQRGGADGGLAGARQVVVEGEPLRHVRARREARVRVPEKAVVVHHVGGHGARARQRHVPGRHGEAEPAHLRWGVGVADGEPVGRLVVRRTVIAADRAVAVAAVGGRDGDQVLEHAAEVRVVGIPRGVVRRRAQRPDFHRLPERQGGAVDGGDEEHQEQEGVHGRHGRWRMMVDCVVPDCAKLKLVNYYPLAVQCGASLFICGHLGSHDYGRTNVLLIILPC